MLPLIGLVGKARSGKNYVGSLLLKKYGFLTWALAHPVKMMVHGKHAKWPVDQVIGVTARPDDLRTALQMEGTELGRDVYGEDIWVRALDVFVHIAMEWSPRGVVICDVRFPNEARFIKSQGGIVLRVVRDGAGLSGVLGNHRSETEMDSIEVDGIIDNNGFACDADLLKQLEPYVVTLLGDQRE